MSNKSASVLSIRRQMRQASPLEGSRATAFDRSTFMPTAQPLSLSRLTISLTPTPLKSPVPQSPRCTATEAKSLCKPLCPLKNKAIVRAYKSLLPRVWKKSEKGARDSRLEGFLRSLKGRLKVDMNALFSPVKASSVLSPASSAARSLSSTPTKRFTPKTPQKGFPKLSTLTLLRSKRNAERTN